MTPEPVIVYTDGLLHTIAAKTCHGLLRGSDRFRPVAVVDGKHGGEDAGLAIGPKPVGVPVYASLEEGLEALSEREAIKTLVVGVAFPGGALPKSARGTIAEAIQTGLNVVCGLHELLSEDEEFSSLAKEHGVTLTDVRKPRRTRDLRFWKGEIYGVKAKRIAVLGTDCAVGKRTTCRFLYTACREAGLKAEMIYTGQTGWMQGYPYGFIFDSTPNDFVSGELEKAIVDCDRALSPDFIFLEGQSALRNPSGPCGTEFLLSAACHGVVLQHAPGREHFHDQDHPKSRIPSVESEIALIQAYGVPVLAVTLHEEEMDDTSIAKVREELEARLGIPVVRPWKEGVGQLVPLLRSLGN